MLRNSGFVFFLKAGFGSDNRSIRPILGTIQAEIMPSEVEPEFVGDMYDESDSEKNR